MKNLYEKPEIIVASFVGEDTMGLNTSNIGYSSVKKTDSNTLDFSKLS